MLVIWDDTFFTKLWCIYEIAVRAKTASLEFLHILPVWVPLFDLSFIAITLAQSCSGTLATPQLPQDIGSRFSLLFWFYFGAPWTFIFYALPFQYFCSLKIRLHKKMLDQMSSFDVREARCALETDRVLIRRQICSFFDEASRPPSLDSLPAEVLPTDLEVFAPLSYAEHIEEVRGITSYPNEDQIIDEFNAYIRGPLTQNVVCSLGQEAQVSLKVCLAANLPVIFSGAAIVLTCSGHANCPTAANHMLIDSVENYILANVSLGPQNLCI